MNRTSFALLMVAVGFSAHLLPAEPLFETITVHAMTPENRPNYRIPALAVAPNGDVLLFTEKRNDGIGDLGNHDLVMVRSSDQGRTWTAPQVLLDDDSNTSTDSTVCIDRERGRIFLFFLKDKTQFAYFASDDSGKTWRGPTLIHAAVTRPEWERDSGGPRPANDKSHKHRYGVGPGAGAIQLTRGPKKGRLLVPARHREEIGGGKSASFSHVFFSDDHGETWRLGPTVLQNGNECRLVELSDGTVMLNMRNVTEADQPDNSRRLVALSRDGGDTWPTVYRDDALVSTPVQPAAFLQPRQPDSPKGISLRALQPDGALEPRRRPDVERRPRGLSAPEFLFGSHGALGRHDRARVRARPQGRHPLLGRNPIRALQPRVVAGTATHENKIGDAQVDSSGSPARERRDAFEIPSIPRICHSERSEESTWTLESMDRGQAAAGFFATLRMTNTGR
jgi:hypothetical protein